MPTPTPRVHHPTAVTCSFLPRQPFAFAVAITGENLFQALAFATANAITFEVIGPDNPFAATLFTVLLAASNLPITYMQFLDGRGKLRSVHRVQIMRDQFVGFEKSITRCDSGFLSP